MTSLSHTFVMLPRELPSYLKVAYSLRYAAAPNTGNCLTRIANIVRRTFVLIKELICYRPSYHDFQTNKQALQRDFALINQSVSENQKPLCCYFVSTQDDNGAILGNHLYYYHHYKIKELQKHFAVAPRLVSSQDEMKEFMVSVRGRYPDREIKFVDIITHGGKSSLAIHAPGQPPITAERLREDLFSDCAADATILLDACFTGLGDRNIADEIARKTPGRKILSPGPSMYFSKPVIRVIGKEPRVISAVHGFAIFNAYVCKSFSYPERRPTQYPYVKDEFLERDILSIASSVILRTAWLDRFVTEDREDFGRQIITVYGRLSQETRDMIRMKICENHGDLTPANSESFLRTYPLHPHVRSAFRSIFNELTQEVREHPAAQWAKLFLGIQNVLQVVQASFRSLRGRQAIPPLALRSV